MIKYSKKELTQIIKYGFLILVFVLLWKFDVNIINGLIIFYLAITLVEGWEIRSLFYGGCFLVLYHFLMINFRDNETVGLLDYSKTLLFGTFLVFLIRNLIVSFSGEDFLSKKLFSKKKSALKLVGSIIKSSKKRVKFTIRNIGKGFVRQKRIFIKVVFKKNKSAKEFIKVFLKYSISLIKIFLNKIYKVFILFVAKLIQLISLTYKAVVKIGTNIFFAIKKKIKEKGWFFVVKIFILLFLFIGLLLFTQISIYDILIWIFFVGGVFFIWDSRFAIGIALFFLILTSYYLIIKNSDIAEMSATYVYYFLIIGIIQSVIEMKLNK